MFTDTKAFSGFAVDDLQHARDFYEQTLGIRTTEEHGLGIFRGGGPHIAWFKDPAGNILAVLQQS